MTEEDDITFERLVTRHFFKHYENGKKAKRSFAEIDTGAGVSRLQND
jgi:hypothetical protein